MLASSRHAAIALTLIKGLGPSRLKKLHDYLGSELTKEGPGEPYHQQWRDYQTKGCLHQQVCNILSHCHQHCIDVIWLGDANYPQALLATPAPPFVLYLKGNQRLLNNPAVAIVGGRNATSVGERMASSMAKQVSDAKVAVVSGLAKGIDTAAHQGAIQKTIAVFAAGLDTIYPTRNQLLAHKILEHDGLWISEHSTTVPLTAGMFTRRNRIIVGLASAVVVIEAAAKSGSLVSAQYAIDYGRELYAVPGNPELNQNYGCHQLIRQGAILVHSPQALLSDLNLAAAYLAHEETHPSTADPIARKLFNLLQQPQSITSVATHMQIDMLAASELLWQLNEKGVIVQCMGRYELARD